MEKFSESILTILVKLGVFGTSLTIEEILKKQKEDKKAIESFKEYMASLAEKKVEKDNDISERFEKIKNIFKNKICFFKKKAKRTLNALEKVEQDINYILRFNNEDQIIISKDNIDYQKLMKELNKF